MTINKILLPYSDVITARYLIDIFPIINMKRILFVIQKTLLLFFHVCVNKHYFNSTNLPGLNNINI